MSIAADHLEKVSQEGFERLRAELERITSEHAPEVASELRRAREQEPEADENVGLALAIEDHAALAQRVTELRSALALARVVDPPQDGTAAIGRRVRFRVGGGSAIERRLVGPLEASVFPEPLSVESPIGGGLMGCRVGDVVEVATPGGARSVELLAVE